MTSALDITVVISAYNYRHYIAEAIDSALAQTRKPLEILVIDDGSSDGTAEFVRSRYAGEPSVRVHSQANQGQLASFIAGTRMATGEVLAFLDADDRWLPEYLEKVGAIYGARPSVDCIFTNMCYFGSRSGPFSGDSRSRDLGLSILLAAYAAKWQGAATSAVSLRRRLAVEMLDMPARLLPQWKTRADDWLVFGADIMGGRKYYLAEVLVEYRAHDGNAWLDQQTYGAGTLKYSLKLEALLAHFRDLAGLGGDLRATALRLLKHEFRSKPAPTFRELQQYSRLLGQSSFGWSQRMEQRFSMARHYLKARLRGSAP